MSAHPVSEAHSEKGQQEQRSESDDPPPMVSVTQSPPAPTSARPSPPTDPWSTSVPAAAPAHGSAGGTPAPANTPAALSSLFDASEEERLQRLKLNGGPRGSQHSGAYHALHTRKRSWDASHEEASAAGQSAAGQARMEADVGAPLPGTVQEQEARAPDGVLKRFQLALQGRRQQLLPATMPDLASLSIGKELRDSIAADLQHISVHLCKYKELTRALDKRYLLAAYYWCRLKAALMQAGMKQQQAAKVLKELLRQPEEAHVQQLGCGFDADLVDQLCGDNGGQRMFDPLSLPTLTADSFREALDRRTDGYDSCKQLLCCMKEQWTAVKKLATVLAAKQAETLKKDKAEAQAAAQQKHREEAKQALLRGDEYKGTAVAMSSQQSSGDDPAAAGQAGAADPERQQQQQLAQFIVHCVQDNWTRQSLADSLEKHNCITASQAIAAKYKHAPRAELERKLADQRDKEAAAYSAAERAQRELEAADAAAPAGAAAGGAGAAGVLAVQASAEMARVAQSMDSLVLSDSSSADDPQWASDTHREVVTWVNRERGLRGVKLLTTRELQDLAYECDDHQGDEDTDKFNDFLKSVERRYVFDLVETHALFVRGSAANAGHPIGITDPEEKQQQQLAAVQDVHLHALTGGSQPQPEGADTTGHVDKRARVPSEQPQQHAQAQQVAVPPLASLPVGSSGAGVEDIMDVGTAESVTERLKAVQAQLNFVQAQLESAHSERNQLDTRLKFTQHQLKVQRDNARNQAFEAETAMTEAIQQREELEAELERRNHRLQQAQNQLDDAVGMVNAARAEAGTAQAALEQAALAQASTERSQPATPSGVAVTGLEQPQPNQTEQQLIGGLDAANKEAEQASNAHVTQLQAQVQQLQAQVTQLQAERQLLAAAAAALGTVALPEAQVAAVMQLQGLLAQLCAARNHFLQRFRQQAAATEIAAETHFDGALISEHIPALVIVRRMREESAQLEPLVRLPQLFQAAVGHVYVSERTKDEFTEHLERVLRCLSVDPVLAVDGRQWRAMSAPEKDRYLRDRVGISCASLEFLVDLLAHKMQPGPLRAAQQKGKAGAAMQLQLLLPLMACINSMLACVSYKPSHCGRFHYFHEATNDRSAPQAPLHYLILEALTLYMEAHPSLLHLMHPSDSVSWGAPTLQEAMTRCRAALTVCMLQFTGRDTLDVFAQRIGAPSSRDLPAGFHLRLKSAVFMSWVRAQQLTIMFNDFTCSYVRETLAKLYIDHPRTASQNAASLRPTGFTRSDELQSSQEAICLALIIDWAQIEAQEAAKHMAAGVLKLMQLVDIPLSGARPGQRPDWPPQVSRLVDEVDVFLANPLPQRHLWELIVSDGGFEAHTQMLIERVKLQNRHDAIMSQFEVDCERNQHTKQPDRDAPQQLLDGVHLVRAQDAINEYKRVCDLWPNSDAGPQWLSEPALRDYKQFLDTVAAHVKDQPNIDLDYAKAAWEKVLAALANFYEAYRLRAYVAVMAGPLPGKFTAKLVKLPHNRRALVEKLRPHNGDSRGYPRVPGIDSTTDSDDPRIVSWLRKGAQPGGEGVIATHSGFKPFRSDQLAFVP